MLSQSMTRFNNREKETNKTNKQKTCFNSLKVMTFSRRNQYFFNVKRERAKRLIVKACTLMNIFLFSTLEIIDMIQLKNQ